MNDQANEVIPDTLAQLGGAGIAAVILFVVLFGTLQILKFLREGKRHDPTPTGSTTVVTATLAAAVTEGIDRSIDKIVVATTDLATLRSDVKVLLQGQAHTDGVVSKVLEKVDDMVERVARIEARLEINGRTKRQ